MSERINASGMVHHIFTSTNSIIIIFINIVIIIKISHCFESKYMRQRWPHAFGRVILNPVDICATKFC